MSQEQQKQAIQEMVNKYLIDGCSITPDGEVRKNGELIAVLDWPEGMQIDLRIKVSESFQGMMDSLVMTKDDIKLIRNGDGSVTAIYGVWIIFRQWPNGYRRYIMTDAPVLMVRAAEEAIDNHVWRG